MSHRKRIQPNHPDSGGDGICTAAVKHGHNSVPLIYRAVFATEPRRNLHQGSTTNLQHFPGKLQVHKAVRTVAAVARQADHVLELFQTAKICLPGHIFHDRNVNLSVR